jgi:hypothetical protein
MSRNNYKQASARSQLRDKVAGFNPGGTSYEDVDLEDTLPLQKQIAGEFIKRVKANIETAGLNVSGKIEDISIEENENGGINILAHSHLIFQDKGVNGRDVKLYDTPFTYRDKMPPVSEIKAWIKAKGINTRDNPKYGGNRTDIAEGAAWAIAKNIQQEGQKPKNVYSKEIPQLAADLTEAFANAAITSIFKGLKDEWTL